jgi:hypothetical protein
MDGLSLSTEHYKHLDWRLDLEVGSRLLHQQVRPVFMLRLDTEANTPGACIIVSLCSIVNVNR